MKGIIKLYSLSIICTLTIGCTTIANNTSSPEVAKYESRCGKMSKEDIYRSTHNMPVSLRSPKYPVEAARKRIEGYVKMEFDISNEGKPININIIETSPALMFDQQAIYALKGWQYNPNASECNIVQLDFTLG